MNNQDASIHDVVEIVQTDPSVAAKVLSVANSAAYGFPNRVDSLSLAATLLGLNETCTLLMSLAVLYTFEHDYRAFWTESMACAQAATAIAKGCGQAGNTGVYAAALLHDIGRIALWQAAPQRYAQVRRSLVGAELIAAEEEVLGLAHPEAGFELASNWNLPTDITEPIRFHHTFNYAEKARETTAIVSIAAALVDYSDGGELDEQVMLDNCGEAMAFLGLDFDTVASIHAKSALEPTESAEV